MCVSPDIEKTLETEFPALVNKTTAHVLPADADNPWSTSFLLSARDNSYESWGEKEDVTT
jgi:hypothetical protein